MQTLKPLFIWAGGKTKMLKHHVPYLPNKIDSYSEPFFGGGAMFIYIMEKYKPKQAFINDINSGIISIYRQVKANPTSFCNEVDDLQKEYLPLSKESRKEFFFRVRHQHAYDYGDWPDVKEAAVLYFLMKTGFNGIWQINKNTNGRYGTPPGLLNQKEVVYNKALVYAWSDLLKDVTILNTSYRDVPTSSFNYFDPPYRSSFTSYGTLWGDPETEDLLSYVRTVGTRQNVMLCNRCDGTRFFDDRKGNLNITRFPVTYTAGRRKRVDSGYEAKAATEVLLWGGG